MPGQLVAQVKHGPSNPIKLTFQIGRFNMSWFRMCSFLFFVRSARQMTCFQDLLEHSRIWSDSHLARFLWLRSGCVGCLVWVDLSFPDEAWLRAWQWLVKCVPSSSEVMRIAACIFHTPARIVLLVFVTPSLNHQACMQGIRARLQGCDCPPLLSQQLGSLIVRS